MKIFECQSSCKQLTTIWYLDGEVACDRWFQISMEVRNGIALTTDTSTVTLAVLDADNGRESSILLSVIPTEAPISEITELTSVYYTDQKITFEGLFKMQRTMYPYYRLLGKVILMVDRPVYRLKLIAPVRL